MNRMRKAAAILLAASFGALSLPVPVTLADGVVAINTAEDFAEFTEKCVYDEYSKGKTFVLQNDIDMAGHTAVPAEIFCGVFEGGGHSITNLEMSYEGSGKGLFSTVTKDAEIHDLNITATVTVTDSSSDTSTEAVLKRRAASFLSKVNIESDELDTGASGAGGIAGYNEGKIINCSFGGKLSGKRRVGGIVGINAMNGIIDSCANGAVINGDSDTGGIAGYNEGRIKLSKNSGQICPDADEKTTDVGGICGESEGAIVICTNDGSVGGESFGDNVGGICGKQSGEIRECINNGAVQGRRSVGGVCGRFEPYTDIELSYESAKAAIDKQVDTLNEDLERTRQKIIDFADELLDGKGIISEVLDRLGIKKGSTGDRLDRLTNSATRMMDSLSDTSDRMRDSNVTGKVTDALESLTDFSNEAKNSISDVSDSLDTTLGTIDDTLNEFDGKGKEITDTLDRLNNTFDSVNDTLDHLDSGIDNINDSLDKGEADIDEVKDKLFTQIDDMEEHIDHLSENLDQTHSSLTRTMSTLRGAGSDAGDFFSDMDDLVNDTRNEMTRIKNRLERLKKDVNDRTAEIKKRIEEARSRLHPTPSPEESASPSLMSEGYSADPENGLDGDGYDVEPSIIGALIDYATVTAHAARDDDDDDGLKMAISDLKSTDIVLPRLIGGENADTALVRYCVNNADVSGHELIGGINGSVGFESTFRSGDSITLPDGTKVDADSVLKAVTDACISSGRISAKGDYAGGVSGKCDIGDIKNSLTTGEVECENGSYAGGTAGYSSGEITGCIAINDISASSYLGGIAGSGKYISRSYSLPRLDGRKDKSGAVAGYVSGSLDGTYFIDEGLSGINGTNLEGKAEAVKPSEIAVSDGSFPEKMPLLNDGSFYMESGDLYMPQINALAKNDAESTGAILKSKSASLALFRFSVTFTDKGKDLKSMTVDYGAILSDDDIPKLRADGTEVPAWDKDVHAPIVRHTVFTTEYNKATMTLSSGEEPPILLVESVFDEDTALSVRQEDVAREFDGYEKGGAYSFALTRSAYDTIRVHVRDERKDAAKIAVEENGKWTLIDCTMDGSYAVFDVGAPCRFVVLYKKKAFAYAALIVACVAAAAAVGVIIIGVFKYAGKEKKDV